MFDDNPDWWHGTDSERLSLAELDVLKARAIRRARVLRSQAVATAMRRLWSAPFLLVERAISRLALAEQPDACQHLKEGETS